MNKNSDVENIYISTSQACEFLGVSKTWLLDLHKRGFFQKHGRGVWKLTEVIQGYFRYQDERRIKEAQQRRRVDLVTGARTKLIEAKIAKWENEYVPVGEFECLYQEVVGNFWGSFDGLSVAIYPAGKDQKRATTIVKQSKTHFTKRVMERKQKLIGSR